MILKSTSKDFLSHRVQFAKDIGQPELYDFIDHFGLFAGAYTIGNKLWTYELLKQTVGIPGDIYEFGCWKGANLMFMAKVISLLEPHSIKKLYGFDNFDGLPKSVELDGEFASTQAGNYRGNEELLRRTIELFNLQEKVELVVGDALDTIPTFSDKNAEALISFAYLDFDLYEPTIKALNFIETCISVGGVIVFDEAGCKEWPGETIAMKEYLANTNHKYETSSSVIGTNPTIALKRVL